MAKPRPKTGERRVTNQPLKIDRLPVAVRDAIMALRDAGRTWHEIEELSAQPYNEKRTIRDGGFVDWKNLPADVKRIFPEKKLPKSNLQRWYDLRVSQVVADTMARSQQARELASAFAKSVVEGSDEAVLNAARDLLMSLLAENSTPGMKLVAARNLIALAETQQQQRANSIKERKVAADERKIKLLEEREAISRRKLEAEAEKASRKLKRGALKPEDLDELVQRTFGIAPDKAKKPEAAHA